MKRIVYPVIIIAIGAILFFILNQSQSDKARTLIKEDMIRELGDMSFSEIIEYSNLDSTFNDSHDFLGFSMLFKYKLKPYNSNDTTIHMVQYVFDKDVDKILNKKELHNLTIKKWVAVGNSITWHPINDNWPGEWGMAATSIENDYVHILNQYLKNNLDSVNFKIAWAVDWETNHQNYDLSYFDTFFDGDEDLVVIRLGENVRDTTNYKSDFLSLIQHLKKISPNAKYVITGIFMSETNDLKYKESIQKEVAITENCIWVPINQLDTKDNRNFVGNSVNERLIENQTVANHPGDKGMQAIAKAILQSLK